MKRATATVLGALVVLAALLSTPAMAEGQGAEPERPSYTPFTVAPSLLNVEEVQAALIREYPPELREEGIGGRVTVWFFIDAEGLVRNTILDEGSGNDALDQAALSVAEVFRFSPALNREERVAVWVSIPVAFQPSPLRVDAVRAAVLREHADTLRVERGDAAIAISCSTSTQGIVRDAMSKQGPGPEAREEAAPVMTGLFRLRATETQGPRIAVCVSLPVRSPPQEPTLPSVM